MRKIMLLVVLALALGLLATGPVSRDYRDPESGG